MQADLVQPALFLLEPSPSSLAVAFLPVAFFVMVVEDLCGKSGNGVCVGEDVWALRGRRRRNRKFLLGCGHSSYGKGR